MRHIMILMLITTGAMAELPDAPSAITTTPVVTTRPRVERFWDRQQRLTFMATFAIRATDAAITCRTITGGGSERWLPTRSCAATSAWIMGGQATSTLAQWLAWRSGHRKLSRMLGWVTVAPNIAGIAYTLSHQHDRYVPKVGDFLPVSVPGWGPTACRNVWEGDRWVTRCY